jgi:hypothetical protein
LSDFDQKKKNEKLFLFVLQPLARALFFFALMQKRSKKNQGKTNAPPFCRANAT